MKASNKVHVCRPHVRGDEFNKLPFETCARRRGKQQNISIKRDEIEMETRPDRDAAHSAFSRICDPGIGQFIHD